MLHFIQLKSLSILGVEGYAVLLNVPTSDCRVLCGSEISQQFTAAEEEKGHALDDMFFKYMCGKSVVDSLSVTSLRVVIHLYRS